MNFYDYLQGNSSTLYMKKKGNVLTIPTKQNKKKEGNKEIRSEVKAIKQIFVHLCPQHTEKP